MKTLLALSLSVPLALGLAACGAAQPPAPAAQTTAAAFTYTEGPITVTDPWVRATTGTTDPSMTAAFFTVDNTGDRPVSLVAASSPVAGMAEIHETVPHNGVLQMQRVEGRRGASRRAPARCSSRVASTSC